MRKRGEYNLLPESGQVGGWRLSETVQTVRNPGYGGRERAGPGRSSTLNASCLRCPRFILDRELCPEAPEYRSMCFRRDRG